MKSILFHQLSPSLSRSLSHNKQDDKKNPGTNDDDDDVFKWIYLVFFSYI